MRKILKQHIACPFCPSTDAYCEYTDGHGYCFSCRAHKAAERDERPARFDRGRSPPHKFGLKLFDEAKNLAVTAAEKYLRCRGIQLFERYYDVLRFHPDCPFGKGIRHPCMISLYRDIRTNEPKAIHRTALTPDGQKIDRRALGPKAACAIKLTADEDVTEGLTIAEGLETALAGMAFNFRPIWALGDANAVAKFPVLAGIECLTILVDNDVNGVGQAAALECSRRWTSAGREVFRVIPTEIGADMADVNRGRAA